MCVCVSNLQLGFNPGGLGTPDIFQPRNPGFLAFKPRGFGVEKFPVAELKKQ